MAPRSVAVHACIWVFVGLVVSSLMGKSTTGQEVPIADERHAGDGSRLPVRRLITSGELIFETNWAREAGGVRPISKGTGRALAHFSNPLLGVRAFNRISGPDANACAGCHNLPYAIAGGAGDVTTTVFELAQRVDFVTFDRRDATAGAGSLDAAKRPLSLETVGPQALRTTQTRQISRCARHRSRTGRRRGD